MSSIKSGAWEKIYFQEENIYYKHEKLPLEYNSTGKKVIDAIKASTLQQTNRRKPYAFNCSIVYRRKPIIPGESRFETGESSTKNDILVTFTAISPIGSEDMPHPTIFFPQLSIKVQRKSNPSVATYWQKPEKAGFLPAARI